MKQNYDDILQFWFQTLDPMQWWNQSQELDDIIRKKFQQAHETANLGELYHWRSEPLGRLAEIIILDQFSRNMYRNTPKAFASDLTALVLAQEAIRSGCDQKLSPIERSFLYMPFMHSESSRIHSDAVELFKKNGIENNIVFELKHKEVIDRFGRYPHRNIILARKSTAEELKFLETHSGF